MELSANLKHLVERKPGINKFSLTLLSFLILSILIVHPGCEKQGLDGEIPICFLDTSYNKSNSLLTQNEILGLFLDKEDNAYFKTRDQTNYKFTIRSNLIEIFDVLATLRGISGVVVTDVSEGKILFSTHGEIGGIVIYSDGDLIHFNHTNSPLPEGAMTFARYFGSETWVSVIYDRNVYVYDGSNWKTIYIGPPFGIRDMEMDGNGVIWLTSNSGLYKYQNDITTRFYSGNSNLNNNNITDIAIDKDNKLYIANFSRLITYDGNRFDSYDESSDDSPIGSIVSVDISIDNRVFIGARSTYNEIHEWVGGGFGVLQDGKFKMNNIDNSTIESNEVISVRINLVGELFCSTKNNGLFVSCSFDY